MRAHPSNVRTLCVIAAGALWFLAFPGAYADAPPKEKKDAPKVVRKTVTYDLTDFLERYNNGLDDFVAILMRTFEPEDFRKGINTLEVVNNRKLVINAPEAMHKQIEEWLRAYQFNYDADVIIEGKLYEADAGVFDKLKPLLAKQTDEKAAAELEKLLDEQTLLHSGITKIHDRQEGEFFSLRQAYLFKRWPEENFGPRVKVKAYEMGFHGVSYKAKVFISPDRRSVRLRITEHITNLEGIEKQKQAGVPIDFAKTSETTSRLPDEDVDDGLLIVRKVNWKPLGAKKKDREILLVVRPVIYIEREERERKKAEGERKGAR
jgi:hypothetical protein